LACLVVAIKVIRNALTKSYWAYIEYSQSSNVPCGRCPLLCCSSVSVLLYTVRDRSAVQVHLKVI